MEHPPFGVQRSVGRDGIAGLGRGDVRPRPGGEHHLIAARRGRCGCAALVYTTPRCQAAIRSTRADISNAAGNTIAPLLPGISLTLLSSDRCHSLCLSPPAGKGSFGEVFKGYAIRTQRAVAIKGELCRRGWPGPRLRRNGTRTALTDVSVQSSTSRKLRTRSTTSRAVRASLCLAAEAFPHLNSPLPPEIAILSSLNSPYVTKYEGSWLRGTELWIVMEYLSGGSCGDLLKPGVFKEDYVAIIIRELLKGLEYLHGEGKLHRDIKGPLARSCIFWSQR